MITVEIPTAHLDAIRDSLAAHREEVVEDPDRPDLPGVLSGLDDLVAQVDAAPASAAGSPGGLRLTGPAPLLWRAMYDVTCQLAERLRDDVEDYWTGVVAAAELHEQVRALDEAVARLAALGPPTAFA